MLTSKQLAEIRERWINGNIPAGHRVAHAERDIPALLDTVTDLKDLLFRAQACLSYRDTLDDKRLLELIEEALL